MSKESKAYKDLPKKVYIRTFGCQMNELDSGKISAMLESMGYKRSEEKDAGLILFNTCTVRDRAHKKAMSEICRAISYKRERPDLIVGVCGCVAQEEKGDIFLKHPKLDLAFGPDQLAALPEMLRDLRLETGDGKMFATNLINEPSEYNWLGLSLNDKHSTVSEFIKIIKGCNNNCSFCIVPSVRGKELSRPMEDIVEEINTLTKSGVKEVVLLGQNVNSFCIHQRTNEPTNQRTDGISDFVKLIKEISSRTEIMRIRYMSPHPKDLTDDLIEEHASNPKLCKHMHLPLQAGSSKVLRDMRRAYSKDRFLERVATLRKAVPEIDITTDIIVGFPGETERDFQDTLDVMKTVGFDGMYPFKYSPRPGTKAAQMEDDVSKKEKEERLERVLTLNAEIWKQKTEKLVGTTQEVLVEGVSKKSGTSLRAEAKQSSESNSLDCRGLRPPSTKTLAGTRNDVQLRGKTFANKIVNLTGNLDLVGHIVAVEIIGAGANSLKGRIKQ